MVEAQNAAFAQSNFCAFVAPYESDQQMAQMYYAGLVDLVLSSDSDMVVYGVPLITRWGNDVGNFTPYNTVGTIAALKNKALGDYVVDAMQERGCDYFRSRRAAVAGRPDYYAPSPAEYAELFRSILQALYQFFYAPVLDLETGHVQSLRPIPTLEYALGVNVLANYTFGKVDQLDYLPVPASQL